MNGWILDRINGSHHIFIKEGKRAIPIPVHGTKEIPKGLVNAILKQAEIKRGK
jgi:predicted RNA binding protein YcfA (HicA-like mRNA interferase family)